ncbi:EAL domain-containing protein [Pseudomonas syringae pv. syringae]|uniref:cyclic-guanylate-specific phosphodiesterase n=7 Tax=Pseudomonas syringae group TaxID=136849 RepID=A0AAJ4B0D7_PSESX|nr:MULTISPECIES: bifunctional diguanylate cyclase/phosphodiesterase [Pseudomonas]AKF46001.1 diguanylate cyclase/phosphodiesterase [Pseudomonas syringae pv. syringae B301D]AVB25958.1 bifunctional diguanylate cyclase/phosphodiesterase [Pseudomonas syringae pv. syringae]EGH71322.1 GGDEF domain-containing protein [Pseudomonas syringae pv. aceris str. M302273]EXL33248.1 putative mucoidy regulator MucR [Pseudomonas syringae pv. syringae str. B301D-R]KOG02420.1 GGDEF domain-containing protein [Pseudo
MLIGSYIPSLVVISILVAILAAYTALDLVGRIVSARGRAVHLWIAGGAVAMGVGTWSTHFIGMLAFVLPIDLGYDVPLVLLSLLIAIGFSGFALWLATLPRLPALQLSLGSLLLGLGISATHYTGMAAMRMQPGIQYTPWLFALSLVIAVVASAAALRVAFHLRQQRPRVYVLRASAALLLGLAVIGMHYTGMAAANFADGSFCGALPQGLSSNGLDRFVLVASLSILGIALFSCILDSHLETRTAVLADSLTQANLELTHLALHDNLTGLPNRALLTERIDQAMKRATETGGCFALMFMDLDGFKPVNDAFGHHTGDLLLRQVALRLRNSLHRRDTLARVGGDEFVLLVELQHPEDALAVARRQVNEVGNPFIIGEHQLQISLSIGICVYPGNGSTQHELLINADAAMYHTKAAGKNGYSFFDVSMNSNARNQLQMSQDLHKAIKHRQFCIYYQPKFDAMTGLPVGAEALLRWNHPEQGVLGPDLFISMAEKTGLIIQIGEWVLDEACRQMREWYTQGYSHWRIAVNLSALQFCHAGLVTAVADTLARHQLPANCLTLEITETTAMHDADASLAVLRRLSEMGVDLSIDDFGTGYSSLMYLKRLPANEIKIDRGFVRDLEHDTDDAAIVSAIVAVGQALNLRIVAEGVETAVQQRFLTHLGCHSLQGFLLGYPLPAEQFLEEIRAAEAKAAVEASDTGQAAF